LQSQLTYGAMTGSRATASIEIVEFTEIADSGRIKIAGAVRTCDATTTQRVGTTTDVTITVAQLAARTEALVPRNFPKPSASSGTTSAPMTTHCRKLLTRRIDGGKIVLFLAQKLA
jgi:hypothetical protein